MDTPQATDASSHDIPSGLSRLRELALNLWWSWTPEARRLFEHIDPTLWVLTHHNPVKLLVNVRPDRLMRLTGENPSYIRLYSASLKIFDGYIQDSTAGLKHSTAI